MGVNKVMFGAVSIIDISDSTVTADKLAEGITAYGADGEKITGTMQIGSGTSDATAKAEDIQSGKTAYVGGQKITGTLKYIDTTANLQKSAISADESSLRMKYESTSAKRIVGGGVYLSLTTDLANLGNATAGDVRSGKTFTSAEGLEVVGTAIVGSGTLNMQEKTVTPSKSTQSVTPDSGYDGLAKVTVNAIPSNYIVPSGTKTITENGTVDVKNYASVNVNVQTSGGSSNDNCEGYHITSVSTALNFKRTDGTIKVWGYGYKSVGMYQKTVYSFCGDGYYTGTSFGTPTKTSVTWGLNSDGTLSGLPSGISALDVLVTRGV